MTERVKVIHAACAKNTLLAKDRVGIGNDRLSIAVHINYWHCRYSFSGFIPRAHAQEVKQSGCPSVCLSVCLSVTTKIARSGDLGVIARCKYHYSVGKVGKRTFFGLLGA